jgi:hypothetical protein
MVVEGVFLQSRECLTSPSALQHQHCFDWLVVKLTYCVERGSGQIVVDIKLDSELVVMSERSYFATFLSHCF